MSLLALLLMSCSAAVMLFIAEHSYALDRLKVRWWAAISVIGLTVLFAFVRSGVTASLKDPSLTVAQMVWTIASGAVAYVIAGDARGLIPSVLAMILFFGTFSLTLRQVIGIGIYALLSFGCAILVTFERHSFSPLDIGYAVMVLIVLSGCMAINLRIQGIRDRLRTQRAALAEALELNHRLATHDDLTGLLNRRAMQERMQMEQRRILRTGQNLWLAQLDIDSFKSLNDSFGHAAGDKGLRAFADAVNACIRSTDVLARWGGEEFVLMLCEAQVQDARELLERIRAAVASTSIEVGPYTVKMTVSAGLALHWPNDSISQTLERADNALYQAKLSGRNTVIVAPQSLSAELSAATLFNFAPVGSEEPRT